MDRECGIQWIVSAFSALFVCVALLGCGDDDPTGPGSLPDFYLKAVSFTGDSIAGDSNAIRFSRMRERRTEDDKGDPYTEVTVTWSPPEGGSVIVYNVFRSLESGIPSGTTVADTIGSTTDSLFVDADSLEWGEVYYYAINAVTADSTILWSDESSITLPSDPMLNYPTPSVLTAQDLPLGRCILTWSECPDDDFASYTLIRQNWEVQLHPDTLGIFDEVTEISYTDLDPAPYSPRYYKVITSDIQGLSSDSNLLEYASGYGLPWFLDFIIQDELMVVGQLIVSEDEDYLYYLEDRTYPPHRWQLHRVTASNGGHTQTGLLSYGQPQIDFDPVTDHLLTAIPSDTSTYFSLRNSSSLDIVDQIEIPFKSSGLLALPTGGRALIKRQLTNISYVIDLATLQLVDTLALSFEYGQSIDGYGTYIIGDGPLRRIDPQTCEIMATSSISPGEVAPLMVSSEGELCFFWDGVFYRLDPNSLTLLGSMSLPVSSWSVGIAVEAQDSIYAYIRGGYNDSLIVYNTETQEFAGKVIKSQITQMEVPGDMAFIESNKDIWCLHSSIHIWSGIYRISD